MKLNPSEITVLFALFCSLSSQLAIGAPFTALAHYTEEDTPLVRRETINEVKELIKEEILNHLVKFHIGMDPQYAATSCKQIASLRPDYPSGYYWVCASSGPTGVYCELDGESKFGESGGWMRVASVNMTQPASQCPPGLQFNVTENKRLCRRPPSSLPRGCSSSIFPVQGVRYSKVCGQVIGYQYHEPYGFGPARTDSSIDGLYVDGVSITHGSPRQHIWTLAAAPDENSRADYAVCPCIDNSGEFRGTIPSFVGNDYYCETATRTTVQRRYYFDDPLWDGEGCMGDNQCCERGGPWFCKELPSSTTDNIELRVCGNQEQSGEPREDMPLEVIELYIQ